MNEVIDFERALFSNLHSEFSKLMNSLKTSKNNKNTLKKILLLNEQMRLLENMMYELKIDVFSNNTSINQTKLQELEDYNKNEKALEHFKPYMLYYRFLLE